MEFFWILLCIVLAVCNGAIPGTEVSTITITSTSITGRTTVTIPEIFDSPTILTSTTPISTASSPSTILVTRATLTTVFSEVLITPTTNSLGQSINLTQTVTTKSFPEPSSTTISLPTTIFSSVVWITTTDSLGSLTSFLTSKTWTTISPSELSTTSTSNLITQTSGSAPASTAATSATSTSISTSQTGLTKAKLAPILVVVGIVVCVFLIWLFRRCAKQDQHLSQPRGNTSWWRHPFSHFAGIFPLAKQETSRATENDQAISRPMISSPIPFSERSTSPPNRPRRPISLSDSLMEDMRTSPQPHSNARIAENSVDRAHRSFSPEPLVLVRNPQTSGPFGPDLEQNTRHYNPYSTTSWSSSVYSTATAGPSLPRPSYQPYRQPELRPQERQSLNEDLTDAEARRLQHEETLRKLEDGGEPKGLATTSEGEEDEVKSQGSYDFAEARARKVLEDKRIREQVWGSSRANTPSDLPAIPELPGSPKRWV